MNAVEIAEIIFILWFGAQLLIPTFKTQEHSK